MIDGDTLAVGALRVRLQHLDAPELSEDRGADAKRRLSELLRKGQVTLVRRAVDAYGRIIADVFVDDENVAEILRQEGHFK